jgi:recombination protein RecA
MKQAVAKAQIAAAITDRFGPVFNLDEKPPATFLSSGMAKIDKLTGGGLPRGAITEIVGTASSGRTSLLLATLAGATNNNETCAVIDTADNFDPLSAANAGVMLDRLLWIRCRNSLERAFKATDYLLQSGGFGLVALNLTAVPIKDTRKIISSWWFRFRRAVETTPTAVMVITAAACVRSCAALSLEMKTCEVVWSKPAITCVGHLLRNQSASNDVRRLSLVKVKSDQSSAFSHTRILRGIEVKMSVAKPTLWTSELIRFNSHRKSLA